ncbi:MAG: phosphopantetheine-binding protein [Victivallales bacterium]|nr:phosphopantetheine-binding protein [Victivallales bacterium]
MDNVIENWLFDWIKNRKRNHGQGPEFGIDYYKAGFLDSFGIIELIEAVEEHFAILFDDQDFKKCEFRTITGLAGIIRAKKGHA